MKSRKFGRYKIRRIMTAHLRLLLMFCWPVASLLAQQDPGLPRYLTLEEKDQLELKSPVACPPVGFTHPPSEPVRAMAEWEELQALLITWNGSSAILTEIVRAARQECRVIICCQNQNIVNSAKNYLLNKSVDITSNVDFLIAPNNSIWIRDYGPNCVYANGVDSLYFIDWIYNRPTRPSDDTISATVSTYMGVPLYSTAQSPDDLVNTGGNFMSDGLGNAFASKLILNENLPGNPYGVTGKTEGQIDAILQGYMGIRRFTKMTTLPYDGIHHIDMHMKLLDEETLLVGQYPDGVADGPQIEANIQYVLSQYQSAFGTPYKIIRIPMPPKNGYYPPENDVDYRTYANAVFVNKTVIVPFYEQKYDTTAQRIWQEALPGYHIVGIDCNSIIPALGAIHCITKEVGVADPLHIVHQELPCMDNANVAEYPVWANLEHRSGIASAKIYYTTDLNAAWNSVDLSPTTMDTTWSYLGYIPKQPAGTVYYYIEATANNGRVSRRPMPAPDGYWKFCVTETVGTSDLPSVELARIYPNPASAITVIPVQTSAATTGSIRLFNALGQFMATIYEGTLPAGSSNYFLDASRYTGGAYWVELRTNKQVAVQKLIIR